MMDGGDDCGAWRSVGAVARAMVDSGHASLAVEMCVDDLLGWMPICLKAGGLDALDRAFCTTMISRSQRPDWVPSGRHIAVMQRIVDELSAREAGQ